MAENALVPAAAELAAAKPRFRLPPHLWLLAPAGLVLALLFSFPLMWMIQYSLTPARLQPSLFGPVTLAHYARFLGDAFYLDRVLWLTVRLSLASSVLAMLIGYPLAYWISLQTSAKLKTLLLAAVLGPLWLNTVIRVFGVMILLAHDGPINAGLAGFGLGHMSLMYNELGVLIGLTYLGIPFFVVSLIGVMENLDPRQREAAYSLGASSFYVFRRVIFPATLPGVIAGFVLIFCISISAFSIPALLGGQKVPMLGLFIYRQAMVTGNLPFGAAMGFILLFTTLVSLIVVTAVFQRAAGGPKP
ncbi:MAG: ABC transporter permease [Pseudomonadota bacterium]